MADFTIDYSSGDKTVAVKPVEDLFEVLHATILDEKLSQVKLDQLLADATVIYDKTVITDNVINTTISTSSSESNDTVDVSSNVFATPTKKNNNTKKPTAVSSPTSIADMLAEATVKLYDSKFIDILVSTFFESTTSTSVNQLSEPHVPILLSIEGNIGAGKSTLLRALRAAHPEWTFIDEPLDTWTALKNETGNLLECFYGDQDRWAYTFQVAQIDINRLALETPTLQHFFPLLLPLL